MNNTEPYFVTLDDDPSVSVILEKSLGVSSQSFSSSKGLKEIAQKNAPLAVFVDIFLGSEESGLDVINTLKKNWPYSPVIVVTADGSEKMLEKAFQMGADDYVRKPLRATEIRQRFQIRVQDAQERSGQVSLSYGDIELDVRHRTLMGPLGRSFLAPVESLMLAQLIKARGSLVQKETLKREAWGLNHVTDNAYYRKLFELRRGLAGVSKTVEIQSAYRAGLQLRFAEDASLGATVIDMKRGTVN